MSAILRTAEIISTGTEILQGLYPDTNAQYLSQVLNRIGIEVMFHTAVGDDARALRTALDIAIKRVDCILIGGGLGPTEDDVTRPVVAELLGVPLVRDETAVEMIRERFRKRGIPLDEYILRQAMIPLGAEIMQNYDGTAPGFIIAPCEPHPCIIALPGPPREMRPIVEREVLPYLRSKAGKSTLLETTVLHTIGVPESALNTWLHDLFEQDAHRSLALLASVGKVDVRINIRASSEEERAIEMEKALALVRNRIPEEYIYGMNEDTLEECVSTLLIERNLHIACAESCTGGLLSKRLTDVSGSSAYVTENYVTYSNEAKVRILGVKQEILDAYGAVSSQTAKEMAEKVRKIAGGDIGIGITGIAGPTGGTPEKPVGLVFIGIATKHGISVYRRLFQGNRQEIRLWTTDFALDLIRRCIEQSLEPRITFTFFNTD